MMDLLSGFSTYIFMIFDLSKTEFIFLERDLVLMQTKFKKYILDKR